MMLIEAGKNANSRAAGAGPTSNESSRLARPGQTADPSVPGSALRYEQSLEEDKHVRRNPEYHPCVCV